MPLQNLKRSIFVRIRGVKGEHVGSLSLQTSLSWAELRARLIFCFSVPLKIVLKRGKSERWQMSEPVFLNFYGPRNRFRQHVAYSGPVRQPYSYSVPNPNRLF
jgi:hypothetical protein